MRRKFDLQLFNSFGGPPAGPAPGPAPTPSPSPAPAPSPSPSPSPAGPAPTPTLNPQTPPPAGPGPEGQTRPDGHVIRSVLENAQQQWRQQHQAELGLAEALRQMGRDPAQILQQLQERQRQEQLAQQTGLNPEQVDPRFFQYVGGLEQQLNELQTNFQRQEGMRLLQEAESATSKMAGQYGMDYNGPDPTNPNRTVRDAVRQFALQRDVPIEAAFQMLYFNHILQVQTQQAQGQTLANLQGRGQGVQPPTSAVAGGGPQAPTNWLNVSRQDWANARRQLRGGY